MHKIIKTTKAIEIKKSLFSLLDEVTDNEVLEFDNEIRASKDKHAIFAEFEAQSNQKPKRSPELLERWTHYSWIRLELAYLSNQKAALNKVFVDPLDPNLDSVNAAIYEDKCNNVPIKKSIKTLRHIMLQIVGTEHPTDPLSQEARDDITKLANAIDVENPDEHHIKQLLINLQKVDAIPPTKRDVEEEVNRNFNMTTDKLYITLPYLIKAILLAYKTHYGEQEFAQQEEEIWRALEGGKQSDGEITTPIARDASWAGFDADGNENVNPHATRTATRLHRIRAAEKHRAALNEGVIKKTKEIERNLRDTLIGLNENFFEELLQNINDKKIIVAISKFQTVASQHISNRNFYALIESYQQQINYLDTLEIDLIEKNKLKVILVQQKTKAQSLIKLTQFSGAIITEKGTEQGDLQKFQEIFVTYKDTIREDTDAIKIKDEAGYLHEARDFVINQFQKVMVKHKDIINDFPELTTEMRIFGIQLRCFGMTYGVTHIRQNSPEYTKIWNCIFMDLLKDERYKNSEILSLLNGRPYQNLNNAQRTKLHNKIQDGSAESQELLKNIYHKYHDKLYDEQYKDDKNFKTLRHEIERLELALRHKDMVENIIIANCESASNILEVESLLQIFPRQESDITIVPLLEKREDLENYEAILTDFIKLKIQQKLQIAFAEEEKTGKLFLKNLLGVNSKIDIEKWIDTADRKTFAALLQANRELKAYVQGITIEVMVGFSDTERVSGLSALISVQKVQENFIELTKDFGVGHKIFHGPGGDPNRGGLKRRDQKATLQGNARNNVLNTHNSTVHYRESQFYQTYKNIADPSRLKEFSIKPKHIVQWVTECEQEGANFYEYLHDTEKGLGKLLGFMLGQGAQWMVNILNSSSRAAQRGIKENRGDRTSSVQSHGGNPPEVYVHPDKPRAITATQMKEMLRDNINLIMGPGFGLRKIGIERAERLYDSSATIRDMFEKTVLGIAMADYAITAHAFFAEHPQLLPKDVTERKEWAKKCDDYPALLKTMDIEKVVKTPEGKNQVLIMLSHFFALLEEEFHQTKEFVLELNQLIHFSEYHLAGQNETQNGVALLHHYPEWKIQANDAILEAEPLCILFSRLNSHVANRKKLDEIFHGLNEQPCEDSKLTRVGRLLGNVGAGITAFRIMPPCFYEKIYLNYSDDLRMGVARGECEAVKLNSTNGVSYKEKISFRFFDRQETRVVLQKMLEAWETPKPSQGIAPILG